MIRVTKQKQPPKMLATRGKDQTVEDCDEFRRYKKQYLSGKRKMPEKSNRIYGSRGVKSALSKAQHNKCCYCERSRERAEIDVEHYRPKGAVKQSRGGKEIYPGYYWLAYDWDNLFLSCKGCNTGRKGILFPLADPRKRARWHGGRNKVTDEQPLFIHPAGDDPRRHLRFRNDIPYPLTKKGKTTIIELGLLADERPLLKEARLEKIKDLQHFCKVVECSLQEPGHARLAELAATAKQRLKDAVQPRTEFSAMALDYINNYFKDAGILIDFLD